MASFICISGALYLFMPIKSPTTMKGLGSCIKSSSSNSIMLQLVGMYSEHMLIVLYRVIDTAIACRFVFKFVWLCSSVLFTIIDVPPDVLVVSLLI